MIAFDIGWGTTLAIKAIIVLAIVPLTALILGYVFLLKMMSHMQSRLGPFRCKIRTPSFNNVSVVPWVLRGVYVPDVITILASLYFILGDIDR